MPQIRKANHDEVPPLINKDSRVLLLGSMLSPKSSAEKFYYAHPQNRFWRVLAEICGESPKYDNAERAKMALSHGIALWDVIRSCDIEGANDNSIKNVEYNDISGLLENYPNIEKIFVLGGKAYSLFIKYARSCKNPVIINAQKLPSTSPLNCAMSLSDLISDFSIIFR